jgi:hypothetical protein
MSPRAKRIGGIGFLVIAIVAWIAITHWPAQAASPYADPAVTGTITLYDQSGHVLTHGDVDTKPFVWRAVSSKAAAAPYNGAGATATLFAFQPRQNATPVLWSGDTLTASTPFTDPGHPTVTATATDFSLKDFLDEFPPRWDGAIQLRIYLDAPGQTALTTSYVAANLKITGNTWTQVPG